MLYDPIWSSAVGGGRDVALALASLLLLERWRTPPIAVVALCVATSAASLLLS